MGLFRSKPATLDKTIEQLEAKPADTFAEADHADWLACIEAAANDKMPSPELQTRVRAAMVRRGWTSEDLRYDVAQWQRYYRTYDADATATAERLESAWKAAQAAEERAAATLKDLQQATKAAALAFRDHAMTQADARRMRGGNPRIWGNPPECFDKLLVERMRQVYGN